MTCNFTSFITVFSSYEDDGWMIMKGCVQWDCLWWKRSLPQSGFKHGTTRLAGQSLTHLVSYRVSQLLIALKTVFEHSPPPPPLPLPNTNTNQWGESWNLAQDYCINSHSTDACAKPLRFIPCHFCETDQNTTDENLQVYTGSNISIPISAKVC